MRHSVPRLLRHLFTCKRAKEMGQDGRMIRDENGSCPEKVDPELRADHRHRQVQMATLFLPPSFLVFYFKSPHLIKFGIPEIPQHKGNKHSKTYCVISKLAPLIIKTTSHSLCKKFKDSFLKE